MWPLSWALGGQIGQQGYFPGWEGKAKASERERGGEGWRAGGSPAPSLFPRGAFARTALFEAQYVRVAFFPEHPLPPPPLRDASSGGAACAWPFSPRSALGGVNWRHRLGSLADSRRGGHDS